VSEKGARQKSLCRALKTTLGKDALCRVPEKKHSAKYLTLGKDLFSGSDFILA
jgi:hypothetical protein